MILRPQVFSLFPYTTLFRSVGAAAGAEEVGDGTDGVRDPLQGVLSAVRSGRSEEHTSELQSRGHLVCRLLLEKKKKKTRPKETQERSRMERKSSDNQIRRIN